jgi:hypothetical protein
MGDVKKMTKKVTNRAKDFYDAGENIVSGAGKVVTGAAQGDLSKVGKGFSEATGGIVGVATGSEKYSKMAEGITNYATGNFNAGVHNVTDSGVLGDDPLSQRAKESARVDAAEAAAEESRLATEAENIAKAKEKSSLLSLRKQAGLGTKKIGSTTIGGGASTQSSSVSQGLILG